MIDNAIILAAGASSRFAPLSYEKHKALTIVKGEVMIERLIGQLRGAGISDIYIITGYKAEQFGYLAERSGVKLIPNTEYRERNNNSSIWAAKDVLCNSMIVASDLFFTQNPFNKAEETAFYAAEFAEGSTKEWCLHEDENGYIDGVTIGGADSWYMADHAFWSEDFSNRFLSILKQEYEKPETAGKLWEMIYMEHLDELKMQIRKYSAGTVFEFDSLDALREFDKSYVDNSRSIILKAVAEMLDTTESEFSKIKPVIKSGVEATGFTFFCKGKQYEYSYETGKVV